MKNTALRLALFSATALSGLLPIAAHAADAAPGDAAPAAAEAEDNQTIMVTATRRTVTLQDVPINISAASGETLAENRVDTVRDLAAFTPAFPSATPAPPAPPSSCAA